MSLSSNLKRPVLKKDQAKQQIHDFIDSLCPRFHAPTDARAWAGEIPRLQRRALSEVVLRGYPRGVVASKPRTVWGETIRPKGAPYIIRKVRFEAYPDYWIPALLYEPKHLRGKAPVVLNPNGHHQGGKAALYKQARCANLARRGMIALNTEFIGMSELEADGKHNTQAHMSMTGLPGVGLFYLAMRKGLDLLLDHKHADRKRVGMTGLSGGGWQTIFLAAFDSRVTAAIPVAGYSAIRQRTHCLSDIGDLEQTPPDLLTVCDYDTMTAMMAPRPTLIILNHNDDCCFRPERAKPVIYDAVRPTYKAFGALDSFAFHDNMDPGTHNYEADNRSQLYKFLNKHFGLSTPDHDIHTDSDIFTERELFVGLPAQQKTMIQIATERSRKLVRNLKAPRTAAQKKAMRKRLADVIRLPVYSGRASREKSAGNVWRGTIKAGPWTIPTIGRFDKKSDGVTLYLHDAGKRHVTAPKTGTVFAVDLLSFGEMINTIRHPMLINCAGRRVLGEQVAQLLAVVKAILKLTGAKKIDISATGQSVGPIALIAAAMDPKLFSTLTTNGCFSTLTHLIERYADYENDQVQHLFCPDLLTVADIPQIAAMLDGVTWDCPNRCTKAVRI